MISKNLLAKTALAGAAAAASTLIQPQTQSRSTGHVQTDKYQRQAPAQGQRLSLQHALNHPSLASFTPKFALGLKQAHSEGGGCCKTSDNAADTADNVPSAHDQAVAVVTATTDHDPDSIPAHYGNQ